MGERTEEASSKKLKDAQKRGQVVKSTDLVSGVIFLCAIIVLAKCSKWILQMFLEFYNFILQIMPRSRLMMDKLNDPAEFGLLIKKLSLEAAWLVLKASLPVAFTVLFVAIIINIAVSGFVFSTEPLMPNLDKFNPINNLQQRISIKALIEALKTLAKTLLVAYVVYNHLKKPEILQVLFLTFRFNPVNSMIITAKIIYDLIFTVIYVMLLIGAFDYWYQRRQFSQDMMMSKSEVKQEYKESEGDPRMKSERKRFGRELVFSASPSQIKQSKVIITNPTHLAIGIAYDVTVLKVPTIATKGTGDTANIIINVANENKIPILRDPDLAWALIDTPVNHIIPEKTFEAIASIFHAIEQYKQKYPESQEVHIDIDTLSTRFHPEAI